MQTAVLSILFLTITCVNADPIDRGARTGVILKMLREMVNKTNADTLNLPANATSIRENITDTFSCENRTYGYYADVDNECQIFHVCLTSQGASRRNTTYKWSFICPKDTVFNQEVLVCTYPRDSIPCEDSPLYYDLNMEIGKVEEDNEGEKPQNTNEMSPPPNKNVERIPVNNNQRRPNRKKQNIIVEELMKEAMKEMEVINENIVESQDAFEDIQEETDESEDNEAGIISLDRIIVDDKTLENLNKPVPNIDKEKLIVDASHTQTLYDFSETDDSMVNTRLAAERSLKRTGRNYRGSIKFNGDNQYF